MAGFSGKEWRGGRGRKTYRYTVADLAAVCGVTERTIWNDVKRGVLVLGDLVSVSRYVVVRGLLGGLR